MAEKMMNISKAISAYTKLSRYSVLLYSFVFILCAHISAVQAYRDEGSGIAVDAEQNVYATGITTTGNYHYLVNTLKYDSQGRLLWEDTVINRRANFRSDVMFDPFGDIVVRVMGDMGFIKYDPDGNILAQGAFRDLPHTGARQCAVDAEGNIICAGSTNLEPDQWYREEDFLIVKYDVNGAALWSKRVSGVSDYNYPYDISVDNSGAIYVTGKTNMTDYEFNATTIKLDESGEVEWKSTLLNSDALYCNVLDNAGNIYDAGQLWPQDVAVVRKIDAAGNLQWEKTYNGRYVNNGFFGMTYCEGDGLYLCGSTYDERSATDSDIIIAKYSDDGLLLWSDEYKTEVNGEDRYEGALLIACGSPGYIYVAGGCYAEINDNKNVLLLKYEVGGNLIWSVSYDENGFRDKPEGIDIDDEENVYMVGTSCLGSDNSTCDMLTIKYDSDGNIVWKARYDYYTPPDNGDVDDDDDDDSGSDDDDDDDDSGCCG
ncbi:MAG: SBBP repeat-containing protein [Candidatus Alcyoniella australis]|nr:SBBP repeat-containing protein [Candidatus Alcyoniella australis]